MKQTRKKQSISSSIVEARDKFVTYVGGFIPAILLILSILMFFALILRLFNIGVCMDDLLGIPYLGASRKIETLTILGTALIIIMGLFYKSGAINFKSKKPRDTPQPQDNSKDQEAFDEAAENFSNEKSESDRRNAVYKLYKLAKSNKDFLENVTGIFCRHLCDTTQNKDYQKKNKTKPSSEIQSILTLLSKLTAFAEKEHKSESVHLELHNAYLVGANLKEAYLPGAKLSGANLRKANLKKSQMQKADMEKAQMQGADLEKAQMQGADLREAQLQKADLEDAQLQGANLSCAQLQEADLESAQLQGADLEGANLMAAFLRKAQLQGAVLIGAQLQGSSSSLFSATLFGDRVKERRGKSTELENVIFSGGLSEGDTKRMQKVLHECQENGWLANSLVDKIESILEEHKNKPSVNKLPEDSGAITGTLTEKEADKIIAAYEKAMGKKRKAKKGKA